MNTLTICGSLGIAALVVLNAVPFVKSRLAKVNVAPPDDPPPQPWIEEIVAAAGATATAEFILKHLRAGSSAADVMAARIKELESAQPAPTP